LTSQLRLTDAEEEASDVVSYPLDGALVRYLEVVEELMIRGIGLQIRPLPPMPSSLVKNVMILRVGNRYALGCATLREIH
jgi:hypothetical protein